MVERAVALRMRDTARMRASAYRWLLLVVVLVVVLVVGWAWWWSRSAHDALPASAPTTPVHTDVGRLPQSDATRWPAFLPPQARDTLRLIERGGPFPHRQDGGVFGNRERELPAQPFGYYHEYTVDTPGAHDRGARRIISGGTPPSEFFYTDDHYRSFRRFTPTGASTQ